MKTFGKLVMVSMAVSEKAGSKEFYTEKLGFSITSDYRRDEANWWVSLELPAGGTSVTLSTVRENMEPGTMKLYLSTPDIREAHKQLTAKGVEIRGRSMMICTDRDQGSDGSVFMIRMAIIGLFCNYRSLVMRDMP